MANDKLQVDAVIKTHFFEEFSLIFNYQLSIFN